MADNKIHIPSSQGGLVRYSEEPTSKITIKPEHVMAAIVIVIVGEILLHLI